MADKNEDGSVDEVTKCPDRKPTQIKPENDQAEIDTPDTAKQKEEKNEQTNEK